MYWLLKQLLIILYASRWILSVELPPEHRLHPASYEMSQPILCDPHSCSRKQINTIASSYVMHIKWSGQECMRNCSCSRPLTHPESIFICWALKKKTVEGTRVMSKYLTYTWTSCESISTSAIVANLETSWADLNNCNYCIIEHEELIKLQ